MMSDIEEITQRMSELTINDTPQTLKRPGRPCLHRTDEEKKDSQRQCARKYHAEHHNAVINRIRIYKENNKESVRDKARLAYHTKKARVQ